MLSIDNAIEYLLSEECGKQDITNKVLTDMNIISDNLINNKYNIINCILYYFTNYFEKSLIFCKHEKFQKIIAHFCKNYKFRIFYNKNCACFTMFGIFENSIKFF